MTTERAARCAAAGTAFAQYVKYYRSGAPFQFRRVVFLAILVGALTFGLQVALLTDVDIRILHAAWSRCSANSWVAGHIALNKDAS